MTVRNVLWQILSSKTKVSHRPAQPFPFPRKFHILIIFLGFSSLLLFVLWAAATAGYDTVSVSSDYFWWEYPSDNWYFHFAPSFYNAKVKPGNDGPCQAVNISTGDVFSTQQAIYQYTIEGRNDLYTGQMNYTDDALEPCYLQTTALHLDTRAYNLRAEALIFCYDDFFPPILGTEYTYSLDPTEVLDTALPKSGNHVTSDGYFVEEVLANVGLMADDLIRRVNQMYYLNQSGPRTYSLELDIPQNPGTCGNDTTCVNQSTYDLQNATPWDTMFFNQYFVSYEDGNTTTSGEADTPTGYNLNDIAPDDALNVTVGNFMNAYISSIRLDLGLNYSNNIFINAQAANDQIQTIDTMTTDDALNRTLVGAAGFLQSVEDKVFENGTRLDSRLQVTYLCQDYKIKTAYGWINNVFGIAWSNFSSAWVIVLMVITIIATYKYPAKKPAPATGAPGAPPAGGPARPAGPGGAPGAPRSATGSTAPPRRPPATTQDSAMTVVVREGMAGIEKLASEGFEKLADLV